MFDDNTIISIFECEEFLDKPRSLTIKCFRKDDNNFFFTKKFNCKFTLHTCILCHEYPLYMRTYNSNWPVLDFDQKFMGLDLELFCGGSSSSITASIHICFFLTSNCYLCYRRLSYATSSSKINYFSSRWESHVKNNQQLPIVWFSDSKIT